MAIGEAPFDAGKINGGGHGPLRLARRHERSEWRPRRERLRSSEWAGRGLGDGKGGPCTDCPQDAGEDEKEEKINSGPLSMGVDM